MATWFLRGLRRGILTTRYPATPPDPWTDDVPSPPVFRPDLLTDRLADELVGICPSRALHRESDELVVDLGACTGCGACFGPAAAPSHRIELAATRRADLVKRIPIRGGRE